jgi:hypothetical protein
VWGRGGVACVCVCVWLGGGLNCKQFRAHEMRTKTNNTYTTHT